MTAWFDRAFGPWYDRLYPHRDHAEAEAALRAIAPELSTDGPVLDLACGGGRHLEILRRSGFAAFGLDRSRHLLGRARTTAPGVVVRGDMRRLPFATGRFSAVLSMFTSFGYFADRAAHVALLVEIARVSRPGARFVLDYLHAAHLRAHLVPRSERAVDDHRVLETRRLERAAGEERVIKDLEIRDPKGIVVEAYREEVAVYDPDAITAMLEEAGWSPVRRLGDYRGGEFTPDSARLVVLADRKGAS